MQIDRLTDHPEHLETVIDWHFAEWSHLHPGETRAQRKAAIVANEIGAPAGDGLPVMYLGLIDGEPVGTAGIVPCDLKSHSHLTPWMASVYVRADRRGEGLGSQLVRFIMAESARRGYQTLYLYTPDAESLYARLGWCEIEKSSVANEAITLMKWDANS